MAHGYGTDIEEIGWLSPLFDILFLTVYFLSHPFSKKLRAVSMILISSILSSQQPCGVG